MRRVLALVIIALAVGVFMALKATRPAAPRVEVRERVWRVETTQAQPATLSPELTLYGRIEAPDQVRAASPVAGRVLEVAVRDGERVTAGQALARLDPRDLRPRLELARTELEREAIRLRHDRAALEQERALLALAEARRVRLEKLYSARAGAVNAVDQVREEIARVRLAIGQREQAIAEQPLRVAQAQARVDEARRDVERGAVVAPFAARIAKVEVAAGDQVQPGQALLSLYADDPVYVRAKLPALYVAELRAALANETRLRATIAFGAATLGAELERIGGEADARGVDVLLRLPRTHDVPLGAFVSATLARPALHGVLSLPFSALHGGDRIYQVRDGRLVARTIERVGEHRVAGEPHMLVRVADFEAGGAVMVTHLPNAIDGLAVEAKE
ncbi:MAG: biotin/lipoyl-binding protein [Rhodocyclales bacterium]|nr:biotin/lipoyl-binding protein [Rhodocyclales bacterium]